MVVVAVGDTGTDPPVVDLFASVSWELAGLVVFVSPPDEDVCPSLSSFRLEFIKSEEVAVEQEVVDVGSCAFWADWMFKAELFCGGVETSIVE